MKFKKVYFDFLNKIKLANFHRQVSIRVKANQLIIQLCSLLRQHQLIYGYTVIKPLNLIQSQQTEILVFLRYANGEPTFRQIKIISTPSKLYKYSAYALKKYYQVSRKNEIIFTPAGLYFLSSACALNLSGIRLIELQY